MDPSPYAEQRYKDGLECARRATQFDQQGQYSAALSFYDEAVEALTEATSLAPVFAPIMSQVDQYSRRSSDIRAYLSSRAPNQVTTTGEQKVSARDKKILHQVEYLVAIALQDDERGRQAEASKMYSCAIELAIQAQKTLEGEDKKVQVKSIAAQALSRLEQLKLESPPPSAPPLSAWTSSSSSAKDLLSELDNLPPPPKDSPRTTGGGPTRGTAAPRLPLTSFLDSDGDLGNAPKFNTYGSGGGSSSRSPRPPSGGHGSVGRGSVGSGSGEHKGKRFTDHELKILRATSSINGVVYLPWSELDLIELRRISPIAMDFEDPAGLIRLSDKQKSSFSGWLRPHDVCDSPKMINLISSLSIKQTLIGDCSFVASLTVSADYERKFKTRLVTRLIHPQNKNGEPILNPHGKYFVSFNLNGCRRRVVIDDRLPVGVSGELLCSYSSNHEEFWVSLIEKAYMKVMGGYDFPGSSSNIDLHALTGWIPERVGLKHAEDSTFIKVEQNLRKGNTLVTVATGNLSEAEADRAGLVSTHAYAVLNVIKVQGLMLLQLKNPWSHKRWKGNYSEKDSAHWTPELKKALHFDQTNAMQKDNGVFWIDWSSVLKFFDVLYMNWKPEMFKFKSTLHDVWKPNSAEKDWYDISSNPQYTLKVSCKDPLAVVWILLSRHITTKNDFANNEKFITLNVDPSDGKRIYYNKKFQLQGVKINTPHYLAKLEGITRGTSVYTIIVAQLESLSTIYYTLKVYSSCEFSVTPVPNPYIHQKQLKGQWTHSQSAQPRFTVTTTSFSNKVLLKLRAPKELFGQLEIRCKDNSDGSFQRTDSGPYRQGLVVLEAVLPKGEFYASALCYDTKSIPSSSSAPFLMTLFSDTVFNFV